MDEISKNDVIELSVTGQGMDGEGVARADGKTVFIRGALPGERVRAKVISVKPRFDVAILEKIIAASPDRVAPLCPVFGKCGGCDVQHMRYAAQLGFKRTLAIDALKKIGGFASAEVGEVIPSDEVFRYRNKLSLAVRRGGRIGLFAKGSHRVVETSDCLLQYENNRLLIAALRDFMESEGYEGYDEQDFSGDIRHLVAREIGGRLCVAVVATRSIDLGGFASAVLGFSPDAEVWLNVNARRDNVILGAAWKKVCGPDSPVIVDGLKTSLHPAGFFQVNDGVREKLYSFVAALCSGGIAVEAYSGAGLMGALVAKRADEVYGIEINREAHEAAVKLARDNGIDNMTPVLGDVAEMLPKVLGEIIGKRGDNRGTFLILDPPRGGVSPSVAATVGGSGAENVVYVSCNPSTLARDLKIICGYGYEIASVTPFDMFPQTANVETVVVLKKAASE